MSSTCMLESANAGKVQVLFGMRVYQPMFYVCKSLEYICIFLNLVLLAIAFLWFYFCVVEGVMHIFDAGRVGSSDWEGCS